MTEEKAPFNSIMAKFERIDSIKKEIHIFRQYRNYDGWKDCLTSYMIELDEGMNERERKEVRMRENNIYLLLSSIRIPNAENLLIKSLDNYQLFLSRVEHRLGWSIPENREKLALGD